MSPAKNVTEGVKTAIIKAVEAKTPYSTISKQFGVSKSTIAYIMKLFRETGMSCVALYQVDSKKQPRKKIGY